MPYQFAFEMRAQFCIPALDEGFTILAWPEIPESKAHAMINEFRRNGLEWKRGLHGRLGNKPKRDVPYDFTKPNPPENECQLFVEGNQFHMR